MRELEIGWCFLQRSFAAVLLVLLCKGKTLRCSFPGRAFRTKPPQKESRSSRLLAQPLDPGSGQLFLLVLSRSAHSHPLQLHVASTFSVSHQGSFSLKASIPGHRAINATRCSLPWPQGGCE